MAISRVIEVSFRGSSVALVRIDTAYFYNNGILFKPTDIDLPTSYQVHWADSPQASSTLETIGTAEGAPIPDDLWNRSRVIYGWIYLHPTEDSGVTGYEVRIYKNVRAGLPDGTEPTPAEQSVIDQAISALNTAVAKTAQDVIDAGASAQSASQSAENAHDSAVDAQNYATQAQTSATQASASASQASASATASAQSASQSAQIKADVEDLVDDAQSYAESALIASQASVTAKDTAQGYAQSASASAQSASGYASNAQTSANTASSKATEASTSAQTASQKATEASQSATNASQSAQTAESAKTASQTAQGLAESARDSAITAKNDAESARDDAESARDEAQQAVASISGALDDKAPVITDTASGAIASFTDGADLPLKSLMVDINPVQDLHGYDSPWPAGGGKNILNNTATSQTVNGITYAVNSDGTVTASGTATTSARLMLGTVTFAEGTYIVNGGINGNAYVNVATKVNAYATDAQFTIASGGETLTVNIYVSTGATVSNALFKPMIRLASVTDSTYAPYENLCPISGWTEVNVNHSDADMTNPTTITINLGQTVYGGKLDVLSGELVVDRAMRVFDGTESGWQWYEGYKQASISLTESAKYNASELTYMCNVLTPIANQSRPTNIGNFASLISSGAGAAFSAPSNTLDEFKAFAQANSIQFCYELATLIEIQLSANQLNSLYGQNNIWADSGDTEVVYRADTKAYIAKKIAEAIASLT